MSGDAAGDRNNNWRIEGFWLPWQYFIYFKLSWWKSHNGNTMWESIWYAKNQYRTNTSFSSINW